MVRNTGRQFTPAHCAAAEDSRERDGVRQRQIGLAVCIM